MKDDRLRRETMLNYLESAHSIASELGEAIAAYLIQCALDEVRARQNVGNSREANIPKE